MYHYFIILFLITLIFSNHNERCGFIYNTLNPNLTRTRPTTDTFTVSPSGHFYIHYDITGNDAPIMDDNNSNGVPDYIDEVGIIADSSRYVLVDVMGFLPEPNDGDNIYDIYIQDMGPGYYGVNMLDTDFSNGQSYIKIDDEFEVGDYYIPGINTMRLTVVHEFFHAIQRSYRIYPNAITSFFYEMSSTWIEDVIVPDGDDYLNWTDDFFDNAEQDIDDTDGYSIALFGHYVTNIIESSQNQMQSSIIKEMWERFSLVNNAHSSIDYVLSNFYNSDFADAWVDFCSRNLYNGIYDDMNNDIYYYIDQIDASPILINSNISLSQSIPISSIIQTKKARFLAFTPTSDFFINITNLNQSVYGQYAIISDNSNNNNILAVEDSSFPYLSNQSLDNVIIVFGAYSNQVIDETLSVLDYNYGDINQNNIINVVDIIALINYIFSFDTLDYFQLALSDLNFDNIHDIADIVLLVNIILNS